MSGTYPWIQVLYPILMPWERQIWVYIYIYIYIFLSFVFFVVVVVVVAISWAAPAAYGGSQARG